MSLTLEIGPNLYLLGKYILLVGAVVYLIVQFWMVSAVRGRK